MIKKYIKALWENIKRTASSFGSEIRNMFLDSWGSILRKGKTPGNIQRNIAKIIGLVTFSVGGAISVFLVCSLTINIAIFFVSLLAQIIILIFMLLFTLLGWSLVKSEIIEDNQDDEDNKNVE